MFDWFLIEDDHHHDDEDDEDDDHEEEAEAETKENESLQFKLDQIIPIVDSILEQDDKVNQEFDILFFKIILFY